jgi:hypothetical protein
MRPDLVCAAGVCSSDCFVADRLSLMLAAFNSDQVKEAGCSLSALQTLMLVMTVKYPAGFATQQAGWRTHMG